MHNRGTARRELNQRPNLPNILRQSYDNAKVMIDLQRTSNLQNIFQRMQGTTYLQNRKIVLRFFLS